METTGERVRKLRKALRLNQTEFASKLGRRQQTVAMWESGERKTPDFAFAAIAQLFGANERWLRTGDGEMFATEPLSPNLPPYEYARQAGCGDGAAQIFARYCELPPEQKAAFEALVNNLFAAKMATLGITPSIKINSITGDNNNATIN